MMRTCLTFTFILLYITSASQEKELQQYPAGRKPLFPGKIIVWAHNTHIDRNATVSNRPMGKLLPDHFKDQLYAVGLYIVNGTTALNSRKIVKVKSPSKGSLEQALAGHGFKTTFLETANPLFNRKITTVSLTDVNGKTIRQFKASRFKVDFDLSAFAAGVYFVLINDAGNIISKKVAKQ